MLGGLGTAPAGGFPAGYAALSVAAAPGVPVTTAARLVDPTTGDYIRNADGSFYQVSGELQRVAIAIATKFGSSTEAGSLGCSPPTVIDATFDADMRAAVMAALLPLGDDITVTSIAIDHSAPHWPVTTITFWANGAEQTVSTP